MNQSPAQSVLQLRGLAKAYSEADGNRLPVDCTWRVIGTVEHWGHIHTRENEFAARMKISATPEGRGRIVGFEVTDEKRVRFETAVRMFEDE